MVLKRETLGLNGIEFFEDIDPQWKPEPHIAMLQEALLDFVRVIPRLPPQYLSKYPEIPEDAILPRANAEAKSRLALAKSIVKEAKKIHSGLEDKWDMFLKVNVFSKWNEATDGKPSANLSELGGRIAMYGGSVRWRDGCKVRRLSVEPFPSTPQPDIYFAIGIQDRDKKPKSFSRPQIFRNFTTKALSECKGLTYSPSTNPQRDQKGYEHNKVCFPFAIVETKHQGVGEAKIEECYCQAANSSSTALSMLCDLSMYAHGARYWWGKSNEVLPVVSFTFIGYHVKLWLAYVSSYNCDDVKPAIHQYEMRCIWRGNIKRLWDAVQLCCIIDHLEHWFIQVYRPWVSGCLDQWRYRRIQKTLKTAYQSEKQRRDEAGISAFAGHYERWSGPPDSESEVTEGPDEDDGTEYNDEKGLHEMEDSQEDNLRSEDDDTEPDSSHYEGMDGPDVTITHEELESVVDGNVADWDHSDDERPVSARTRSRSNSAVPESTEIQESLSEEGETTLSPNRATASYKRPTAQHVTSSPLERKIPLRTKHTRRLSALN